LLFSALMVGRVPITILKSTLVDSADARDVANASINIPRNSAYSADARGRAAFADVGGDGVSESDGAGDKLDLEEEAMGEAVRFRARVPSLLFFFGGGRTGSGDPSGFVHGFAFVFGLGKNADRSPSASVMTRFFFFGRALLISSSAFLRSLRVGFVSSTAISTTDSISSATGRSLTTVGASAIPSSASDELVSSSFGDTAACAGTESNPARVVAGSELNSGLDARDAGGEDRGEDGKDGMTISMSTVSAEVSGIMSSSTVDTAKSAICDESASGDSSGVRPNGAIAVGSGRFTGDVKTSNSVSDDVVADGSVSQGSSAVGVCVCIWLDPESDVEAGGQGASSHSRSAADIGDIKG
jgi:hypothetical protein